MYFLQGMYCDLSQKQYPYGFLYGKRGRSIMIKAQTILQSAVIAGCVLFSQSLNVWAQTDDSVYTRVDFAMDTVVSETVYSTGEDITEELVQILKDLEEQQLSWTNEESQISLINAANGSPVEITEDMQDYLERILHLSEITDGAFDPTIGKIIRLWDIGGENEQIPDEKELNALLENVGYQKISLEDQQITLEEDCTLDLGGVGKGIGSEVLLEYLSAQPEITGALINLGGSSILSYLDKPVQSSWKVGVTDPRGEEDDYLGVVELYGTEFLSTSGDYEKYFIEDGVRYHHIFDPETGYPVQNGITSVTVVCDSGLEADALSTACFVLGVEKSLDILDEYDADALFADDSGHIYMTEGMKERFTLMSENYTIEELS
jgi:thiamine biosynthesis lipoprotein